MGMLIQLDEATERVASEDNLLNRLKVEPLVHKGNGHGRSGRGIEAQAEAVAISKEKTIREAAAETGYSQQHIVKLRRAEPTGEKVNSELEKHIEEKVEASKDRALDKLMDALDLMDEDKLKRCNARDLSSIASNMSNIAHGGKDRNAAGAGIQIVVYAPRQKELKEYEYVDI